MLKRTCLSLFLILSVLLFATAAFAGLAALSYTDTNNVQQTVGPPLGRINPSDAITVYLYDTGNLREQQVGYILRNASGQTVAQGLSSSYIYHGDQFTVLGQTYYGKVMTFSPSWADGNYTLTAQVYNSLNGVLMDSQDYPLTVDRTAPQITVYNGASQLANHGTLTSLDQVKIALTDNYDPSPQLTGVLLTGGPQNISVNLSFSAQSGGYVVQFPTINPSGGEYSLAVTAKDSTGNVGTQTVAFSYTPPVPSFDFWQAYRSDTGWSNLTSGGLGPWQFNSAVTISVIRVVVQARTYDQVFVDPGSGSCTIPAGQTGCTFSTNITASPGTMNWYQTNCYVKDPNGILTSATKTTNFQWDLVSPSITSHTTDQTNKTVTFQVTESQTGGLGGAGGLASGWVMAHNTGSGQDVRVNGTVAHLSGDNYQVTANYASLSAGNWQFTLWAQDNFGNTGSLAVETVSMDQTPPQITVYNGASPLADHGTVTSLDQVKITLADNMDPSPQLNGVHLAGGPQNISADLTFNYQSGGYVPSFPVMYPSGAEYTLTVTAQDASGNVGTQSVAFSYTPPGPSFDSWQAYRSDTGWSDLTSGGLGPWQFNSAVTISKIRVVVQARSYDQVLVEPVSGSCTIPAGQTECTLSTNIVASPGTMKWYQPDSYVKDPNGILISPTKHANFQWDLVSPSITTHTLDQANKTVTFQVNEPQTGDFGGAVGLASGWLMAHNTGTGQDVRVNGTVAYLSGDNHQVTANYASLPEGFWQLTLWAKDNFGNTGSLLGETVVIDRTAPQITIYNGSSPLSDHGTVTGLNQVKITLTDNLDPSPQLTGIHLSGGPQNISVDLTYNPQSGGYVPSFPIINPSGGEYSLAVTAKDSTGNIGTQSVSFSYTPPSPSFDTWQAYRSDTGWSSSTSGVLGPWQFNTAVAISKIRVVVQARTYDQIFMDPVSGSCTIPAGQTECTLSTNITASPGTMKWYQSNCYVKDLNGILNSSTKFGNFQWDLVPPSIASYAIDRPNTMVTFQVTEPQTGSFGGASGLSSGWLIAHNTGTSQDVQVNGTVIHLSGDNHQVTVNYATLPEGNWQLTLLAQDNFGNTGSLVAETVVVDRTAPQITVYNGASQLANHGTLTSLEQVKITLTDNLDPSPQLTGVHLAGGPQNISVNLSYSAQGGGYLLQFPTINPSGGEYSLTVTAKDATGNVGTQSVSFSYTPPSPSFDTWQAYRSDAGWSSSTSGGLGPWQFNSAVAITQIRVVVQARPYDQVFVEPVSGSCTIPAGQTGCTLNTNITASAGTMKWYQSDCYVKDPNEILISPSKHTDFQWDLVPPSITSHTTDQTNKTVTFQVTESQTGDFGGAVNLASGWVMAHNTGTGQDVQVNGTVAHLSGDNYQVTVNYATLPEGNWQLTLWAQDNFGNTGSLAAETVVIDRTAPQVTIYNGASQLVNHGTVTSLDQVKITLADNMDPSPQLTGVYLTGGPQNIAVNLTYHFQSGAYVPDFPPMYPSGGEYSLTVTAQDATGNVAVKSVYFSYSPPQINISSMNLPAIPANVVHNDGSQALNITITNGGAPISGTYDVMVASGPDSTTTVTVRGAAIAPSQQIILSAYNFSATGGSLILPIRADEPGQVNLQVISNAPNSPAVSAQFIFWLPEIALTADPGWGVQPFVQTQKIGATVSSGPCQVTMDAVEAKRADPINSPKCLVEFTQKPAAYQINSGLLQGVLGDSDALEVDYQVSVYNGGQKYVLGNGSHTLDKLPIKDVSVKMTPTPGAQVTRKLQNLQVGVQSDGVIPCNLTNSQTTAQKYASSVTVCFLRWTQTPNGLQPTSDNTGALSGTLQDPGDQSLTLAVDLYTSSGTLINAFSRSLTLTGINPNPPTIDVAAEVYGQKLDEGKYATSDLSQGQFGRLYLKSSTGGNLVLEIDSGDGGLKSYQYSTPNQSTSYSLQLFAGALTAWQNKTITTRAYYKDMPDVKAEASLNVMGVPSQQVQARLTATQEATDISGVPVKLEVGRPGHGTDINYTLEQDGSWEARFGVIDSNQQFNPVTDYQEVKGGVLETTLGGFHVGCPQLSAQVRLKPPEGSSGYNREINSNSFYATVFRGAAPQGKIICRSPSGPAPLGTPVSLQLDNDSSQVLGDVAWEISADQGASWQPVTTTKTLRDASLKLTSGQYLVHARLSNRITQQSGYTDNLQIIAYKVPQLIVNGPQTVYLGSPVNLTAQVQVDGQALPPDGTVVEWYNTKKEKVQDGPTLSITTDTQQVLIYRVRARMKDAPDTDKAAWINADVAVRIISPRPIGAILAVPNYMEYNTVAAQSYTLSAKPVLPMGIDTDHFTIQSEWHLPDGRIVSGLDTSYNPTSQDAANKQGTFKFVSWIDGYKDQTSVTYTRAIAVGTYTWPAFEVDSKANPAMAPSSVILTAQPVDLDPYKLQQPACQWLLPPEAQKLRDLDRGSRSIMVNFPNPGDFDVSVRVTDARGSTAQAAGTVSLAEAPGCQVSFNPIFSNPTRRELLDVRPQPSARCGHPQDSLVMWQFSVDDPQAQIMGVDQNALIKGLHAGNWVIHLHAVSKLGKTVDVDYPLTVVANQPPTCTIKTYDTSDARWFNAACKDPDGRVVATRWFLNDQQASLAPTLMIKRGTNGVLRFEAEDDAGGKYNEVLNTP